MTGATHINRALAATAVLSVIIVVSGIGIAYSYNSTIQATAELETQYLSIDIYESDNDPPTWEKETSELSIVISSPVIGSDGHVTEDANTTLETDYCVRVSSNTISEAYVYGYFTCENGTYGAAVEYLLINFEDGTSTKLYRDAYASTLLVSGAGVNETATQLSTTVGDDYRCADFVIDTVTVHYYPGITVENDKILFGQDNGSGSVDGGSEADAADLLSISDFEFHFIASCTALLS